MARAQASHPSPLAPDIARLSRLFTTDRSGRAQDYMRDPALRRAYLGFFVPTNAVKVALLLERLQREGAFVGFTSAAPRVLDIGAGPLTGLLGAHIAFGALGPALAVDIADKAMEEGAQLLRSLGVVDVTCAAHSIASPPSTWRPRAPVDLVIAANVLNELGDPRRAVEVRTRLLEACVDMLAPGGRVLVVEPGTRVHGRSLLAVRDALVERGRVEVLAPCRGVERCPLLRTDGDWCHGETHWERPAAFAALERAAAIPKDVLKESHLLLARPADARAPHSGHRLVGGLMAREVDRRYACGPQGLVVLAGRPRLPASVAAADRGALLTALPAGVDVESRDAHPGGGPRGGGAPARSGRAAHLRGRRPDR